MISFANATGNCFNILGKLGALVKNVKNYQTTQKPALIDTTTGAVAQLFAMPDIQAIIGNSYLGVLAAPEVAGTISQQVAVQALNRIVFNDQPQPGQTFTSGNTLSNLLYLIAQMQQAGASVLAMTITATVAAFTGQGNGVVLCSVRRPLDGKVLENAFGEQVQVTCIADSYSGGAQVGNEFFSVQGDGAENDVFAYDWPQGSGYSTQLQAINGNANKSQGNYLTNSGFETWAAGLPTSWTIDTNNGTIFQETSITYGGNSALRIQGDGTTLTQLRQQFGSVALSLKPQTQYGVNFWMRRDGVAANVGTLVIELVDGTGTPILDAGGNNLNSLSVDLTQLTVGYAAQKFAVRTPAVLPAQQWLRLRLSTALTNGRSVYLDTGGFGLTQQLGPSCPFFATFSGGSPFLLGDQSLTTITNSRGAAGTLSTFQTLCAQLYPQQIISGELLLSSSATPTISDSALIS